MCAVRHLYSGNPAETNPDATEPADTDDGEEGGSALKVVLIVMIVLVVLAGGAVGVILYLRKKKAQ